MKQRNAPRAAVPDWSGQRHHHAERGTDAGRPADAEHDAEHRRSGQARPRPERRLEDPPGEHEPVERAEEQQAEQDRDPAEDLGDPVRVRLQQLPDPARRQADQREHGREAEDEQRRSRDRPAPRRLSGRGRRRPRAGGDPAARAGRALRSAPESAAATAAPSALASAPDMPVMYARYPGTSGRQHGDRNVTAPAAAATGMASSSGPDPTRLAALMPAPARSAPRSALAWFPVWPRVGDARLARVPDPISLPV